MDAKVEILEDEIRWTRRIGESNMTKFNGTIISVEAFTEIGRPVNCWGAAYGSVQLKESRWKHSMKKGEQLEHIRFLAVEL